MADSHQIAFEESDHTYCWKADGVALPSVTTIIKEVLRPFEGGFASVTPARLDYLGRLGKAAHRAAELDLQGRLDESTVKGPVLPYFEAWKRAVEDLGIHATAVEQVVGSRRHGFAGTLDFVGTIDELGGAVIGDIKTTSRVWDHIRYQLALYDIGLSEGNAFAEDRGHYSVSRRERVVIWLKDTGKYALVRFRDEGDYGEALRLVSEYHKENGGWA